MKKKIIVVLSILLLTVTSIAYLGFISNKNDKDVVIGYGEHAGKDENITIDYTPIEKFIEENIPEILINENNIVPEIDNVMAYEISDKLFGCEESDRDENSDKRRDWYTNEATINWNGKSVELAYKEIMGDPNVPAKITLEALCKFYEIKGYTIPSIWAIEDYTTYTYIVVEISDNNRRFEINNYTLEIEELD